MADMKRTSQRIERPSQGVAVKSISLLHFAYNMHEEVAANQSYMLDDNKGKLPPTWLILSVPTWAGPVALQPCSRPAALIE